MNASAAAPTSIKLFRLCMIPIPRRRQMAPRAPMASAYEAEWLTEVKGGLTLTKHPRPRCETQRSSGTVTIGTVLSAPAGRERTSRRDGPSGRDLADRLGDAFDDLLDQQLVIAFAGDADHRLGPRWPHDQPAMAIEALFGRGDRGKHLGVLVRLAALVAHVARDLRQRIEAVAHFRDNLALLLDYCQHLESRDEAIAGRGVVGENDVAGRLAAEIVAVLAHVLEDVAVADRRAHHAEPELGKMAFEAEVRHHGRDDAGLGEAMV